MSSTNRGAARAADDYYATPAWCTLAIVRRLFGASEPSSVSIVDPCAGEGAIIDAVRRWNPSSSCVGLELDDGRASVARARGFEVETRSALAPSRWPGIHVVTNPPFRLAREIVERCFDEGKETIAVLLRLAWLEGKVREAFHREHPANVFVLPRRPSFTGRGTDSAAYAWFVWAPQAGGRWEILNLNGCLA